MLRSTRILTGLVICAAPLLIGAAKPRPVSQPFVPALAYKYGSQELRLSNADGSQAVLLVRMPRGDQPLWLTLAPPSKRQVAYIEALGDGSRSVRLVSWTQSSPDSPLAVTIDSRPLLTLSGADGFVLADLDYSDDGTKLVVLATDAQDRTELRFFDVASRTQIGDAVSIKDVANDLSWRSYDDSVLLNGVFGKLIKYDPGPGYVYGTESPLFDGNPGWGLDTYKGTSPEVLLGYKNSDTTGGTIQRWDGVSLANGSPVLTKLADGIYGSVDCDNSRLIYSELGAKRIVYILILNSGEKLQFSRDSNVQRMTYPKSCT